MIIIIKKLMNNQNSNLRTVEADLIIDKEGLGLKVEAL